jgi:hypothetical protein
MDNFFLFCRKTLWDLPAALAPVPDSREPGERGSILR